MERTKLLAWIIVLALSATFCNTINAQKFEKKVGNQVYVIDNDNKEVYNQSNSSIESLQFEAYDPDRFEVTNWPFVKDTIKETLSADRIKELSRNAFGIVINCDYDGNILSIQFIFSKGIFLTVEEIEKIETELKKQKFSISASPNAKREKDGIQIGIPFRMTSLLK